MDKKIVNMSERTGDGTFQSPEQALQSALEEIGNQGSFFRCKKLLILALDEGENGDIYNVSFIQAGMKMSQCVALCEVAKVLFLEQMEYINPTP